MARARQTCEWDRAASLEARVQSLLSGEPFDPAEFHPLRQDELPGIGSLKPKEAP